MINVYVLKNNKAVDVTMMMQDLCLSSSIDDVAKQLEFSTRLPLFTYANITRVTFEIGDLVWVVCDGDEIFKGRVIKNKIDGQETQTVNCFDFMFYLTKNTVTYNFKNITAKSGTNKICADLGIKVGSLANSNISINKLIAQKKAYDAIMGLYTQVSKQTDRKFIAYMYKDYLYISDVGYKNAGTIELGKNLIAFEIGNDMTDMVNKVKVYDENNNLVYTANNSDYINKYGLLQDNYVKEDDKDYKIVSANMLKGITQEITVEVLGSINYMLGRSVNVKIPCIEALNDKTMYITSVKHTWDIASGSYATSLTLNFNKTMVEVQE